MQSGTSHDSDDDAFEYEPVRMTISDVQKLHPEWKGEPLPIPGAFLTTFQWLTEYISMEIKKMMTARTANLYKNAVQKSERWAHPTADTTGLKCALGLMCEGWSVGSIEVYKPTLAQTNAYDAAAARLGTRRSAFVFHGTRKENPIDMLERGKLSAKFGKSGLYGTGIYGAERPGYVLGANKAEKYGHCYKCKDGVEHDECDIQTILLCSFLIGNNPKLMWLETNKNMNAETESHDWKHTCVIAGPHRPTRTQPGSFPDDFRIASRMIVCYEDDQVLPLAAITYYKRLPHLLPRSPTPVD